MAVMVYKLMANFINDDSGEFVLPRIWHKIQLNCQC